MSNIIGPATMMKTLIAKTEAVTMVDELIKRNMELEEIYQLLQPLLYALSTKLYGDDNSPKTLHNIVEDTIKFLGYSSEGETLN